MLDAVSRGLRAALVERDDFASSTSCDVRFVREGLRERQRLFRNSPHLVHVLPVLLPMLHDGPPVSDRALDPNGIVNPGKLGLPDTFGDVTWRHATGGHAT